MSKLLNISNRVNLPPALHSARGKAAVAGGLDNTLATCPGFGHVVRMGWSGETIPDGRYNFAHPERHLHIHERKMGGGRRMTFMQLDLPETAQRGHYEGRSNGLDWPASHFRPDLVRFSDQDVADYSRINEIFARATASVIGPDWTVLIHDYHFEEFAGALQTEGKYNPTGMMRHIPFYDAGVLARMDKGAGILRGSATDSLFAYDFVGLQAPRDVLNWQTVLDAGQQPLTLKPYETGFLANRRGGRVYVGVCPATADADMVEAKALAAIHSPELKAFVTSAMKGRSGQHNAAPALDMVAYDRLDYTKALPKKLCALRICIEELGADPASIHLVQAAPTGRDAVYGYNEERAAYTEIYRSLRQEFGNVVFTPHDPGTNKPIAVPLDIVAGTYRRARAAIFTSDIDGQHLGPGEFFASASRENPGVAVMTRTLGAAAMFENAAVMVDPIDRSIAEGMMRVRDMPLAERRALFDEGRRINAFNTNARWLNALVTETIEGARQRSVPSLALA